ncbi:MAG: response regulator [Alphaproteobacteria bacterium]|nr:response regulator [Alphaproteobacteria bacterium]
MRAYDLSAVSVLIVEPNRLLRDVLRDVLFAFGIEKLEAVGDPTSARALLHDNATYDLMLTELDFEHYDGADLIRDIRQHSAPSVRMIPVIALTLDARIDRVVLARDCGATEILTKPICAAAMYDRIVALIEQPRDFVRLQDRYFGPDRRRRFQDFARGKRRVPAVAHA